MQQNLLNKLKSEQRLATLSQNLVIDIILNCFDKAFDNESVTDFTLSRELLRYALVIWPPSIITARLNEVVSGRAAIAKNWELNQGYLPEAIQHNFNNGTNKIGIIYSSGELRRHIREQACGHYWDFRGTGADVLAWCIE